MGSHNDDVLGRLIGAGKDDDFDRLAVLLTEPERLRRPSLAPDHGSWLESVASLNAEDLAALIKALAFCERHFPGWGAGSVSPVIRLYRRLSELDAGLAEGVAEWVLSNTDNPYLPFGSDNLGAKTVGEYRQRRAALRLREKARAEAEEVRKFEARERKAEQATHNLFNAVKRGDLKAVVALLGKGADPTVPREDGMTAIDLALSVGDTRIISMLRGDGACS